MIMENANGGELFDFIVRNTRLSEKQAAKFYWELISGIEYLHKSGVCHRDLKPENLLLDYDNTLKIVDFGLSNMYEKNETLKTACGSPCYAAPEVRTLPIEYCRLDTPRAHAPKRVWQGVWPLLALGLLWAPPEVSSAMGAGVQRAPRAVRNAWVCLCR